MPGCLSTPGACLLVYPYSEKSAKLKSPLQKERFDMTDIPEMTFPIGLTHPLKVSLDPNTGELVFECFQLIGGKTQTFRFLMEPRAALTLLSVLPEIQRDAAHIIEAKAKQNSLQ